jgi:hypothetical protein
MRKASIYRSVAVILLFLFHAGAALAVDVIVSGENFFLVIDVDGDGPDEVEDCRYLVDFSNSTYTVTPVQDPPTLRACTGNILLDLMGSGQDDSSDWAEFEKSSSGMSASGADPAFPALNGFVSEPYEIEIIDESGDPDGAPLDVNWIRMEDPPGGDQVKSEVFICDKDGPVLAVEVLKDLLTVHLPFVPYPSALAPEFYSVRKLPFQLAPPDAGTIVNRDVYLPVTDGSHFTVTHANTPDQPFIDIDFEDLTDCSRLVNLEPPAPEFVINDTISDAWSNPPTSGQGFVITVWEGIQYMFLAWFTFDSERPAEDVTAIFGAPGQRWVTAQGQYEGDTATLDVYLSSGGVLNMVEPKIITDPEPIGTIIIKWTGCDSGTLTYNIPSLGLMGVVPIQRVVKDKVPACMATQPQ